MSHMTLADMLKKDPNGPYTCGDLNDTDHLKAVINGIQTSEFSDRYLRWISEGSVFATFVKLAYVQSVHLKEFPLSDLRKALIEGLKKDRDQCKRWGKGIYRSLGEVEYDLQQLEKGKEYLMFGKYLIPP